ncbi:MAG: hypothetical protein AAGF24_00070 [Cyanobacteria bacterium P01_H01_bin.121]
MRWLYIPRPRIQLVVDAGPAVMITVSNETRLFTLDQAAANGPVMWTQIQGEPLTIDDPTALHPTISIPMDYVQSHSLNPVFRLSSATNPEIFDDIMLQVRIESLAQFIPGNAGGGYLQGSTDLALLYASSWMPTYDDYVNNKSPRKGFQLQEPGSPYLYVEIYRGTEGEDSYTLVGRYENAADAPRIDLASGDEYQIHYRFVVPEFDRVVTIASSDLEPYIYGGILEDLPTTFGNTAGGLIAELPDYMQFAFETERYLESPIPITPGSAAGGVIAELPDYTAFAFSTDQNTGSEIVICPGNAAAGFIAPLPEYELFAVDSGSI